MGLQKYRALLLILTAVSALFIASPALQKLVFFPQTVFFTELSFFGPYNNATYPSSVTVGNISRLYLNVDNHLGSCAYYVIEIKFRNQTQSAPDSFNHTSSVLPSLGSITFFVADNESLQLPIDVSFQYKIDANNSRLLDMQSLTLNGATINVNPTTIAWDSQKNGFYGNLFFELWLYNDTTNALEYHQRYVNLWLKMNT
ncbi:MAG: DUF1616 domain-containing protein [Candidatus Bathyarchaeota archaeon]|nr:DUF1616 domain-containing protein [Candidatus Bathyarchaeota archaeon]